MVGESDMQPSTSKMCNNDDNDSDSLPDDFEDDDRSRELALKKIHILKKKMKKLQDRSVNFDNDQYEEMMFAEEERIQKQLSALIKKFNLGNNISALAGSKDLSSLLVLEGTGSPLLDKKITAILQEILKSSDLGGRLDRYIDREELVRLCKICRSEETASSVPSDPQVFDKFVNDAAAKISLVSTRYRAQFYENVWDDYLEDDEKEILKTAIGATTQPTRNRAEVMEELAKQVEVSDEKELDDGDNCSGDPSDESTGEDVIEDGESLNTAIEENYDENITTADVLDQETRGVAIIKEINQDLDKADAKSNVSFCEILDIDMKENIVRNGDSVVPAGHPAHAPEVLSISSHDATDNDYIEVVYEKEVPYTEPVNSQKNGYVWNWLINKCSSSPDPLQDDEPDLKRARLADNEIDDDGEVLPPSVQPASPAVIVLD